MKNTTQKIVPNLWFDGNAQAAVEFYVTVFPDGEITEILYYPTEGLADFQKHLAGQVLTIDFRLAGHRFTAINAGSEFSPNPAISFFVNCDTKEAVDELWEQLIDGGMALMPLDSYPFSERYGWVEDTFGVSWQIIYSDPAGDWRPRIMPSLMFTKDKDGQAAEAMRFYTDIFPASKISDNFNYYPADDDASRAGNLMYGDFQLAGAWLAAMDGGAEHDFRFNEAISLMIVCAGQAEIDHYWDRLSAVAESEVCGWLKDRFGVSWQVAPAHIGELVSKPKAFQAMMGMKKLDIAQLEAAAGR